MIFRRKKYLFSIFLSSSLIFCQTTYAFFGQTHCSLSELALEKIENLKINENEKSAFLSGSVCADIGKFEFDDKAHIESDSKEFSEKLMSNTVTSEEKWFAIGVKLHVLEDKSANKFLKNIFKNQKIGYLNYIYCCGTIDNYFLKKDKKFIYFENFPKLFDSNQLISKLKDSVKSQKSKIIIKFLSVLRIAFNLFFRCVFNRYYKNIEKIHINPNEGLLKRTYQDFGLNVNETSIKKQTANILSTFLISSYFVSKKSGSVKYSEQNLEKELEDLIEITKSELVKILCEEKIL